MSNPLISDSAVLGEEVEIGFGAVVGAGAVIGFACRIGSYAVIHPGTRIGHHVRIDDHAVVGKQPMRSPRSAMTSAKDFPPALIGDHVQIGTGAILYAGCRIDSHVLVADLATVREEVEIGAYTIVGRGVAIENACRVGCRCKIETNAYLAAKTTVEDDVFIAPGVLTSNDNFLGRTEERFKYFGGPTLRSACRLGVGAIVLPGRTIEGEAVVAAGAVLTHDAKAGIIHSGVPARELRPVPKEQFLHEDQ